MATTNVLYKKGQRFRWLGCTVTITRVAKDQTWANVSVLTDRSSWTKRVQLPLPPEASEVT